MKRLMATLLALLLLAACGGESQERVPQGTEEDQQAFEAFLSNPFITEEQAEQSRDQVWRACEHFSDGGAWPEFEEQEIATSEEEGVPLGALQITGMRAAAALGILAYCPDHEDKKPQ